MADPSDVTLGEMFRLVAGLESRINKKFDDVQGTIAGLSFVSRDVYEVEKRALVERVEDLEESRRWMVRTLVASLLLPILVAGVVAYMVSR